MAVAKTWGSAVYGVNAAMISMLRGAFWMVAVKFYVVMICCLYFIVLPD